jgi:hypothetical protein
MSFIVNDNMCVPIVHADINNRLTKVNWPFDYRTPVKSAERVSHNQIDPPWKFNSRWCAADLKATSKNPLWTRIRNHSALAVTEKHTATTGSLESAWALAGVITLTVRQSSLDGVATGNNVFITKSTTWTGRVPSRYGAGSVSACWGQAAP